MKVNKDYFMYFKVYFIFVYNYFCLLKFDDYCCRNILIFII